MINFNEGMQKIEDKFNNLKELSAKYSDYQSLPASKIVYQDANNAEDEAKAKQITRSYNIFLAVFVLVFALTTVLAFAVDTSILVKLLLIVITACVTCILVKSVSTKPKVIYGIAIYKDKHIVSSGSYRRRRYIYYITFIPDNGEKVLYTNIQVSSKDYEQIQEGTRVMVVNKGPKACIL